MDTLSYDERLSSADRKLHALGNIARLRRAQQRFGRDRDLAAVRAALERELGETVSRRTAARFLGVSHTALARWINAGDVPVVYGVNGRTEVPVAALLDLHQDVSAQHRRGARSRHVIEASLAAGRERAVHLDVAELAGRSGTEDHGRAEVRALAYHRAVGDQLTRAMLNEARHRVWRWHDEGKLDPRYAGRWETVLEGTVAEVAEAIGADTSEGRDLRQSSPFAGMISEPERRAILAGID